MKTRSFILRAICLNVFLLLAQFPSFGSAQEFDESFDTWPLQLTIRGTLVLNHSSTPSEQIKGNFVLLANDRKAKTKLINLVLPGGEPVAFAIDDEDKFELKTIELGAGDKRGDDLLGALKEATGVWISSPGKRESGSLATLQSLGDAIKERLQEGRAVCVCGFAAEYVGSTHVQATHSGISPEAGLGWMPDCVVRMTEENDNDKLAGDQAAVLSCLQGNLGSVGILVEPETALVLRGRKFAVAGANESHFFLAGNDRLPLKQKTVAQPTARPNPYRHFVDLTAWRRQAIDRRMPLFPASEPSTPFVENGTLFIVGGGGMPQNLLQQFIEKAGGKEARLVYVPCSEQDEVREPSLLRALREAGVASATMIHTKDRNRANDDEAFLKPLRDATGIWFGGGRQWNFSDSYYGTTAHKLMKDVLKRGGAIGGSSAGASIQGRYLARANPLANFDIMADGYERGLGFLSGVAIDQHFSQRRRQANMTQLVERYPQLLGIGIDEATAIVVEGSMAEVVGRGRVFFYDRNRPVIQDQPDFIALPKGYRFDLKTRTVK